MKRKTQIRKGAPRPHPHPTFYEREEPKKIDGVMLKQMRKDLESIKKEIDSNYRRLDFGNPVVNHMLEMIVELLEVILKYVDFEEVDKEIEGLNKEGSKTGFGISKEDLDGV